MGLIFGERLQNVSRHQRNSIAGLYVDVAVPPQSAVVGAISPSIDGLRALVCRAHIRIVTAQGQAPKVAAHARLYSLPARLAEIREITEAGLLRRHK